MALDAGGHIGGVYKLIPNAYGDQLISVSFDKTIRVWDLQTGEPFARWPPRRSRCVGGIAAAALHPEGDLLAIGGYRALTPIYDHRIRLISLASGESVRLLKGHAYMVFDLAFSPDGKRLASGALDSTGIWNVETGETEHVLKGHTNGATRSPGGARQTPGDGIVGRHRAHLEYGHRHDAAELTGHRGPLNPADWSPDGRSVLTGCDDAVLRLFEPDGNLVCLAAASGCRPSGAVFSGFACVLCTYSSNGLDNSEKGASVLSMVDGREISRFNGHENGVISCAFSATEKPP